MASFPLAVVSCEDLTWSKDLAMGYVSETQTLEYNHIKPFGKFRTMYILLVLIQSETPHCLSKKKAELNSMIILHETKSILKVSPWSHRA